MKRICIIALMAIGVMTAILSAGEPAKLTDEQLKSIRINGSTNKSALSYLENEPMIFTFKVESGSLPLDGYFLSCVRRGDDGKSFNTKVPASETLTVKTSLDRPGFVSVAVKLVDAKDEPVVVKLGGHRRRHIGFYAGTAVKAETLKDCGEPADFDEFWAKQRKRLDAVPFKGLVKEEMVKKVANGTIYAVTIPCVGRPATGYLCVPDGAAAKSLPAEIVFYGYGAYKQPLPGKVNKYKIQLYLNAHGQEMGRDDAYYKEFFKSIRTKKYSYGFNPEENKDPETAFFNGMCLRLMRALEYLKSRPEWDGRSLRASGGSQGGLQTMWAAALDQDVNVAYPSITWCCDLAGMDKAGRIHGPWRIAYTPALDYYDPVFMAKRIKKARVYIRRAGLGDYTCPPSGLAISYNNLATPNKSISWVQGSDHGFIPEKSEVIVWKTGK
ncbi:MAG: acetylxylan esterase [Lentisphaeria bacterium]|nr:acetylxylan esterase [Lentisphaeria bacterium]